MSSSEQNPEPRADKTLDCSGKRCPMPIYMATKVLATMRAGEILQVKCTDASSVDEFPNFAKNKGHNLLTTKKLDNKAHLFYLRKGES